jgi:uncharacterized protein YbjT (DUF2867 family)
MKVILFGATGMLGQGVLRECLRDPQVTQVLAIVRGATGQTHEKLREPVHTDFFDYASVAADLAGYDACFFCLGVSSVGMDEAKYRRLTHDLTLAAANALAPLNPGMTFVYVSGRNTDSSEKGSRMWARVKGETENALMRLPFKAAYMFRPAAVEPMPGGVSKTPVYRVAYAALGLILPLMKRVWPQYFVTMEQFGRAMISVARDGHPKRILESEDIGRF